ncbi:chemotaxis response regulator protein-glutamate methylesterase [bacterium]|nr:chemotaxis response regulator protein-glutamate methylesterase [bacterium]
MSKKIRVLVVDDSALMRKALREILSSDPEIEVIGTARDGEDAIVKAIELEPDVITMDINMPGMDGLTALQYIVSKEICPVVMVSSLTQEGALATFEALELGAFDYVPKPGGTISLNIRKVSDEIIEKVKLAGKEGVLGKIRSRLRRVAEHREKPIKKTVSIPTTDVKRAVAIGVSTGGPKTLMEILPELPADLDAVVFIVQHMPPNFTASFAKRLDQYSQIPIKEAEAGDIVTNNSGYLGKGGYHLLLRKAEESIRIRLSTKPELLFIPSVNVMMESVLEVFGSNTVGVLLTGMGDDGADAMVKIRRAGGITIAESEETAIVFGMPKEAIERGGVDIVAPSYKIAEEIVKAVKSLD